jgi:hypothetical protein
MRRLDLYPAKKLRNPARHLRNLHKWTDAFTNFHWDGEARNDNFLHWRIAIPAKLISEPHTTQAIQAEVIQCLVDAATRLHTACRRSAGTCWSPR